MLAVGIDSHIRRNQKHYPKRSHCKCSIQVSVSLHSFTRTFFMRTRDEKCPKCKNIPRLRKGKKISLFFFYFFIILFIYFFISSFINFGYWLKSSKEIAVSRLLFVSATSPIVLSRSNFGFNFFFLAGQGSTFTCTSGWLVCAEINNIQPILTTKFKNIIRTFEA